MAPHRLDPSRLSRIGAHFRRFVDDGRLPGWQVLLSQAGEVVYDEAYGCRDVAAQTPWTADTIMRLYSNTKIITSVAALMLWEEGAYELRDPLHAYIPAFKEQRVFTGGNAASPATVAAVEPTRIWHVFTHTSGLTYGFLRSTPVDEMYRTGGLDAGSGAYTNEEMCDRLAAFPLCFQPGTEWNYSMSTDVLGRLVEVWSGQTLGEFFRTRIFEPLGMTDTAFWCPDEKQDRLATLYAPLGPGRSAVAVPAMGADALTKPTFESGGGGLVGTSGDYHRFLEMLRRGGELDGVRLLAPTTVRMMASNHLPGGVDLQRFGRPIFAETNYDGMGFGLGVSVMCNPVAGKVGGSVGDFGWGGMASTWALVDPAEELSLFFATQLMPSSAWPLRTQLRQLVHQALV